MAGSRTVDEQSIPIGQVQCTERIVGRIKLLTTAEDGLLVLDLDLVTNYITVKCIHIS